MIKLEKVNGKTNLDREYEQYYKLIKDNQEIGYGTINKDKENAYYIFINEGQRGNGYGKILFSKILEESKGMGWTEPKITFEKENIPMIKIAVGNGAVLFSSDGAMVKYSIKLK